MKSAIIKNPLVVSPHINVREAIVKMSAAHLSCQTTCREHSKQNQLHLEGLSSCVLVVDNQKVMGIITERDVVRLLAQDQPLADLCVEQAMTPSVVTLKEEDFTDLFVAINLLKQHRIRHLPLLDAQGHLIGLITHASLRQISRPIDLLRLREVQEVMSSQVVCASIQASLLQISQLMAKHRVSCVVITDTRQTATDSFNIPVGMITERDLVQFHSFCPDFKEYMAETLMSSPVFAVKPQDSLWVVQQKMEQHFIRRVVVTGEQGELLGIVTQTSLLQALNSLELYKLVEVLGGKVKNLEAEKVELLEMRNAELEAQVEARTAELEVQREREQIVARATRLKDEFLANMSHELRTPLNAILGMTEGLQEQIFGPINEQQIKALQTIERSGSHLLELINDILDVAKIESGQIQLEYNRTPIAPLCTASLAFVKQQALKKKILLETKIEENLPDLWVDERRIRQVLINLLNNAVKFTSEGGKITLKVFRKPCSKNAEEMTITDDLRIAIIDTGIGISPENLEKLFKPFVQIDSALNRKYTGTGLGLALVKQIVELHGGKVGVSSQVNLGSCFTVDLPCLDSTSTDKKQSREPDRQPTTLPPSTPVKSPLILLVDDNEANIITVSSYLKAKGYQVCIGKNGSEGVSLAASEQPNLILMDIQMPEMDGLEAIQKIRQDLQLVDIPIIALTALAMEGDRDRALEVGADQYLSKPVKLKQLVTTIEKLLANRD